MNCHTLAVKTAISVPDRDFERFEGVAARHGMNRSEFYRLAATRLADELEGEKELIALTNSVIDRAGQPCGDGMLLRESERGFLTGSKW